MDEMKAIAGGQEYIGSLQQVEILFNKVPNVVGIKSVYNLIELTCKYTILKKCKHSSNEQFSNYDVVIGT